MTTSHITHMLVTTKGSTMPLNLDLTLADWPVCQCGNEPDADGFFTCSSAGEMVSPEATGDWDGRSYLCFRCGAIYDITTFEQTGEATVEVMRANYLRGDTE